MQPGKRAHTTTDPEILLKRRQDRQKASEKLQLRLDEQGIKRNEIDNNLTFSTIPQVLLINQKNYFTEYLKKDDNLRITRNMREKINKNLKIKNQSIELLKRVDTISGNVTETDDDDDDVVLGEGKTIVIHPGSHDIKIGWADDVDPIIIPNIIGYAKEGEFAVETRDKFNVEGLEPARVLVNGDEEEVEEEGGEDDGEMEDGKKIKSYFTLVDDKEFREKCKPIRKSYKERMKYYKHRILPNCHSACFKFNRKQQYEDGGLEVVGEEFGDGEVEDDKNMFIEKDKWSRKYVVGEEVYRLKNENEWTIRSPFLFKCIRDGDEGKESDVEVGFNEDANGYASKEEVLGDIENIIRHILKYKFDISKREEFGKINVMLVIPSLYRKTYVENMVDILFNRFRFQNVSIIQDGLSASFGLGVSTGCIVDIGSDNIHICCVDEGMIIEDSRVVLGYGMNDVVRFWGKLLIQQQFPKVGIDFKKIKDWKMLEGLFYEHCTFDDNKSGVIQVGSMLEYESNSKARRYTFKIFDENMISCMGLFYPEVFGENGGVGKKLFKGDSYAYNGYNNYEPISILQELQRCGVSVSGMEEEEMGRFMSELGEVYASAGVTSGRREKGEEFLKTWGGSVGGEKSVNTTPLDVAIIESIMVGGVGDKAKEDKLFANVCVVGGGGKIEGIEGILRDRVHLLVGEVDVDVTAGMAGGEADARTAGWKGGSVFARLKVGEELVMSSEDWELLGARALNYGSVFSY